MDIELKLKGIFGRLYPDTITLGDNEDLIITPTKVECKGQGVLFFNGTPIISETGVYVVPANLIEGMNTIRFSDVYNGEEIKFWKVHGFVINKQDGVKTYQDELAFYKEQYKYLTTEIARLKEFKANALKDIESLINSQNALRKEFETVKEEMAI